MRPTVTPSAGHVVRDALAEAIHWAFFGPMRRPTALTFSNKVWFYIGALLFPLVKGSPIAALRIARGVLIVALFFILIIACCLGLAAALGWHPTPTQ